MATSKNGENRRVGRPSKYSKELAVRLCAAISVTTKPLAKICKANKAFPNMATIYRWIIERKDFCEMYDRARENRCQLMADQVLAIADTPEKGEITITKETPKGTFIETRVDDMVRHRELQVDTRKWLLAKLRPDRFGDKLDISATMTFDVPPITTGTPAPALKPGQKMLPTTTADIIKGTVIETPPVSHH